jgi:hypothetical protein
LPTSHYSRFVSTNPVTKYPLRCTIYPRLCSRYSEFQRFCSLTIKTNLGIINGHIFYVKHKIFGDWILSPSSRGAYSGERHKKR